MAGTGAVKVRDASALLSEIYRNVRMAEDSIINIMPKVTEERLKNELTVQISVYSAFSSRAAKLLAEAGVKPEEEGLMARMSAKWGIFCNTLKDPTQAHLAQMLIEGTTMGVGELLRLIREAQNGGVTGEALQLAQDVLAYEEQAVEEMKAYLR